jgi:hypothetical protein
MLGQFKLQYVMSFQVTSGNVTLGQFGTVYITLGLVRPC